MNEATIKELEQLQNEKRKMLVDHESLKLKQREEAFSQELKEWKGQLKPRKQVRWISRAALVVINTQALQYCLDFMHFFRF